MTTAISLWIVYLGAVALYVRAAANGIARGANPWWYVAGAPLVYLAILGSITLFWFALAWAFRSPRPQAMRIGLRATLGLFWDEMWAIAGSSRHMAMYRLLPGDPPPRSARAPVLLLHGVLCNAGSMHDLRTALVARGIGPVYTLSYGPPLASIDSFVDQVAAKIDAILAATGARQVAIVGHSMGGLVARAYLRRHGGVKVGTVITIGTPHKGSVHAWLFPGVSLGQLRPSSAWLAELDQAPAGNEVRIVSVWSWHDSMVAPQTSAELAGAENIALAGIGHNALVSNERVFDIVAAELTRVAESQAARRAPAAPSASVTSGSLA
jgi:triacylglycerol esterase/lipase EstA (alpha/beta hydrolase family)